MKLTKFQFSKNFIDFCVTMEDGYKYQGYYNPITSKITAEIPQEDTEAAISALLESSYHLLVESLESAYNDN